MADTDRGPVVARATGSDTPATIARYGVALARDPDARRRLRRAREAFFEGSPLTSTPVRNEILGSWRRSRTAMLAPDDLDPPYEEVEDRAAGLLRSARPVIEKLATQLAGTGTSIILTDRHGWIVARWADTSSLSAILDRNRTSVGFSLREDAVGTNGLGSVIEARRSFQVCDAEHFAAQYLGLTCAGAPIRHPINGRLEGVIDITCRFEDTNALLLPLALRAAADIEGLLYQRSSARERALLERHLIASRRPGRPVVSLGDDMVIASASASRILSDLDMASLWEGAAAASRASEKTFELATKDGSTLLADCQPAYEADELFGAVVHLGPTTDPGGRPPPRKRAGEHLLPRDLAGVSPGWCRVVEVAERCAPLGVPTLIEGEAGTGKRSVARAIHALAGNTGPLDVHCCAMARVDDLAHWFDRLRQRLDDPRGSILLCHLDALETVTADAMTALIEDHDGSTPRILATRRRGPTGHASDRAPLLDTLGVVRIVVPPLRDRPADVEPIVRVLTDRHGHHGRRWRGDALGALARHDWPQNVRQLERVVRETLLTHRQQEVTAADLPPELLASSRAPFLGELEQAELEVLLNALDRAGGNKTQAAKAIGMARSTLYRKLRSYGLDLDRRFS